MDFKFGVLLAVSAYICTAQALPPCTCARNYRPVCGSDGTTYSNLCMFECVQQTSNKDLTVVKDGPCDDPPAPPISDCICTFNYLPVCGSDGTTYPNECSLNCEKKRTAGLEMVHYGDCKTPQEPPCVCTREKKPVCGSDGNTYSNDCLLNCATKNNSRLSISHFGPCEDKVKVVDNIRF